MKKKDKAPIPMGIYFAYGSNLNLQQMRYRCPSARLLGVGLKQGYALRFRGRGPGYSFLTVTATSGAVTPVAAFAVSPSDVAALNYYEGVATGHYRFEPVSVDIRLREAKGLLVCDEWREEVSAVAVVCSNGCGVVANDGI